MKELELKYGCNPNQKPSRIYMLDGDLPSRFSTASPAISTSWTPLTPGSWIKELKAATGLPRRSLL